MERLARSAPTRDLLVQVAGALLEDEGLEAVTLREVGRRSGLSRSAPYRHFASKEGLLAAVAADGLRRLRAQIEEAAAGSAGTPLARVAAMVGAYLAFAREHQERYRLVFSPIERKREDPALREAAEEAVAAIAAAVGEAVAAGELPSADPRALAALVVSAAHGAAELERSGHLVAEKWTIDADGVAALLVATLAAAAGAAGDPRPAARAEPGAPSAP